MTTIKITPLEAELMNDIVTNEYANGQRAANVPVWTASVIETRSRAAVLGSLAKKGLAGRDNFGKDGDNEDACVWLTDAGFAEWQKRQPAPTSAAMDVVPCTCCTAELTIDPSEQVGEPMCAICADSFEKYMDSMGMNDPAYLKHLEAMENEHRAI